MDIFFGIFRLFLINLSVAETVIPIKKLRTVSGDTISLQIDAVQFSRTFHFQCEIVLWKVRITQNSSFFFNESKNCPFKLPAFDGVVCGS